VRLDGGPVGFSSAMERAGFEASGHLGIDRPGCTASVQGAQTLTRRPRVQFKSKLSAHPRLLHLLDEFSFPGPGTPRTPLVLACGDGALPGAGTAAGAIHRQRSGLRAVLGLHYPAMCRPLTVIGSTLPGWCPMWLVPGVGLFA
ncbi:hypothetical protein, partial [Dokdonella sp.]|uniref:hypothetical protein n=1 Tax=Dokdonella sp. TaxID=2291710 RepID=UPI0025BF12EB